MRPTLDILFWVAALICVYAYVGYGVVITLLARLRPRPVRSDDRATPTVSLIICAYNEEQVIEEKLANSFALDYPAEKLEIIVVSDGSTDRTAEIVAGYADRGVVGLHLPERRG
jgi:poly-beta-1,6-N-acetyl-D-glucosamine synthase